MTERQAENDMTKKLTPEQVRKLPDAELDALVARLMGWRVGPSEHCTIWWEDAEGRKTYDLDQYYPTHDATQALAAFRHAQADASSLVVNVILTLEEERNTCSLHRHNGPSLAYVSAPTLERAISEALVLAR